MDKKRVRFVILSISILGFILYQNNQLKKIIEESIKNQEELKNSCRNNYQISKTKIEVVTSENLSRDFYRHSCKMMKRIGGHPKALSYNQGKDNLWRIEGAWFLCLDVAFAPKHDECVVVSFGIKDDPSFDNIMNTEYGCQVESFDPFFEADFFKPSRVGDQANTTTLRVTPKWNFHRIGLSNQSREETENQIGWLTTFSRILTYTQLHNKQIDVLKMDIENYEWEFFHTIDMDYMCEYVKQFVLETHPAQIPAYKHVNALRKLEKCFRLFHRDTRFYSEDGFLKTEFQEPIEYLVPLRKYKTEISLIDYMVSMGELYFVNINFL